MFNVIYSPVLNTILCCILAFIVCLNVAKFLNPNFKGGTGYFLFWLFITLFSMYYCPEESDTFYGAKDLIDYHLYGTKGHYEDIYYIPLTILPPNYYLWRFFVWGLSSLCVVYAFKILDCHRQYVTSIFLAFTLIPCYYYMRNSLGFATFYLSIILLLNVKQYSTKQSRRKVYSASILLLIFSYFTHNSMPVYYLLGILSLVLPFNLITICISLLAFPIIKQSIVEISTFFLAQDFLSAGTSDLGMNYLSGDNSYDLNLNGLLFLLLRFLPFFIVFGHAILNMKREEALYKTSKFFFMISYLIFYLSVCFYGTASDHLFLRFSNSSTLSMTYALVIYLSQSNKKKIAKAFLILMILFYSVFAVYQLK